MTQKDWEYYYKIVAASVMGVNPDHVVIQYLDTEGRIINATTEPPNPEGQISLAE